MEQKFRFKKAELGVFNTMNSDNVAKLIEPNCRIIGLTRGEFSLIDLIYSVLKKIGASDIISCTWSAGIKDAHQIEWMLNNELIKSFCLVTDHSYATRQKKYAVTLDALFGKENIRTSEIHAKFVLIKNENYNLVINTSMNLNANRTCENFEINDDIDIYNFYNNFILHTFDNMPKGFEPSSKKVNDCLDQYFQSNNKKNVWWK